jgi:hypothetical protein
MVQVHVNREVLNAGQDLSSFMDRVYQAVNSNFSLFDGEDKWDVYPEEIHSTRVIVRVSSIGEYKMADMSMGENEISLSNVRKVKRQWLIDDDSERSEVLDSGDTSVVSRRMDPTFWGSVVG